MMTMTANKTTKTLGAKVKIRPGAINGSALGSRYCGRVGRIVAKESGNRKRTCYVLFDDGLTLEFAYRDLTAVSEW